MPEIGVQFDEHDRVDLVCKPLPGEDPRNFLKAATKISLAGIYLKDFVNKKPGKDPQEYFDDAMAILLEYMPKDAFEQIAQAYIDRNTHLRAAFISDSQGNFFKGLINK